MRQASTQNTNVDYSHAPDCIRLNKYVRYRTLNERADALDEYFITISGCTRPQNNLDNCSGVDGLHICSEAHRHGVAETSLADSSVTAS